MKRILTIGVLLFISFLSAYSIGDTVGDHSWTDNNGEYHSVHELVDSGRVIVFFWGENW
ncbi:MAG: hypothetical protein K9M99_07015 [Candidatus Cloacimonetes bacterium]|nr:hypothetical protein [Candidatus Cloacimonadota bacterium]